MATTYNGGCGYGKGTRWGIGLFVGILLTAVLVAAATIGDSVQSVKSRTDANTAQIYVNREALARIEERLNNIDKSTQRIEGLLDQRPTKPKGE